MYSEASAKPALGPNCMIPYLYGKAGLEGLRIPYIFGSESNCMLPYIFGIIRFDSDPKRA